MKSMFVISFVIFSQLVFSQEIDCDKMFNEAKKNYEEKFNDVKLIDYSNLGKVIINNFDFKRVTSNNLVLHFPGGDYCPVGVPNPKCDFFSPETPYYNIEQLWSGKNILLLQSLIKKNIIPETGNGFISNKSEFENMFKTQKYREGLMKLAKEIYYPNSDKNFLYFPIDSKNLILEKGNSQNKNNYEFSHLETRVQHVNSKEVRVEYVFRYIPEKNYYQIYNYKGGDWKLTTSKSLQ